MRISKLAPSNHIQGRWLCHLEDGSILRITENEIVAFGLCSGLELPPEQIGRAAAMREDILAALGGDFRRLVLDLKGR